MRILADENIDALIVAWLRQAGHDVKGVTEFAPGRDDEPLAELACAEARLLLTRDRDFGELVYRQR